MNRFSSHPWLEHHNTYLFQTMGERLQLDTSTNQSLWKDRVALELNYAILESFNKAKVTIVDQFTVSDQFQSHLKNEMRERGGCPADWVWLTPSQSGSLTPLFHQEMLHYHLSPSYERQHLLWTSYRYCAFQLRCRNSTSAAPSIIFGFLEQRL